MRIKGRWINTALLFSVFSTHTYGQSDPVDWKNLATHDLAFVRSYLMENHPANVDSSGEEFRYWLDEGYRQSTLLISGVHDLVSMQGSIAHFTAGFADGHLGIGFSEFPDTLLWPRFIAAKRGQDTVVVERDENNAQNLPSVGWKIINCDGRAPDDILRQDVLPYLDNRPTLQSVRKKYSPFLFALGIYHPRSPYQRCDFLDENGHSRSILLNWQEVTFSELLPKLIESAFGPPPELGVREISENHFWVSFPSFWPKSAEDERRLRNTISELSSFKNSDLVVIDVRGNGGGSSMWGELIVEKLFGEEVLSNALSAASGNSYAEWRVSSANLAAINNDTLPRIAAQFGTDSEIYRIYENLASRMMTALYTGLPFVRQADEKSKRNSAIEYKGPKKVVLLTNGRCASACLDFADLMLVIPDVIHAGQETAADTFYMEARMVPLPSGLGNLVLPQKVWRDRLRGSNIPLTPILKYEGDISNTPALLISESI